MLLQCEKSVGFNDELLLFNGYILLIDFCIQENSSDCQTAIFSH